MKTVEDILMSKGPDVLVASPETTALEAARMMSQGKVGSIIVVQANAPAGVFTERDLLRRVVVRELPPAETPLSEVMSTPVISCRLSDTIEQCRARFAEHHVRHLAIVEDGALVGLVSIRDVLQSALEDAG